MLIEMKNIYKKYGKEIIFNDLNFKFYIDGSITAILGPNGAGKTTFLKLISGILTPYKGELVLLEDNKNINEAYITWAHQNIAYLSPDERYLSFKNSAFDNILYYGMIKGVDKQIILKNLNDFTKYINCNNYMNKRVEQLSTGQKKVIKILSIFSTGLPILLLDEPTIGLDVDTRETLITLINKLSNMSNSTVMVSTHDLEFASKISNKQIFIFDRKIKKEQKGVHSLNELKEDYLKSNIDE